VGLERGTLSLVSATEELLGINGSGFVGIRHTDHLTPLSAKVGTNFAESGGPSVGVVRSRTKVTEFAFLCSLSKCSPAPCPQVPATSRPEVLQCSCLCSLFSELQPVQGRMRMVEV
jgi:hypothetical protein